MNAAVNALYAEYLEHTGGDKAAAAILALAAVLHDSQSSNPLSLQPEDPGSLTVKEAAVRLNLSSKKVYRMCLAGELRCFRAGRAIRVSLEEIERFEQNGPIPAAPRMPMVTKRHY